MKKKTVVLMVITALLIVACSTHVHTIGTGPETGKQATARQYYLLYGLVPLNTVNTNKLTAGAVNYEIQTQIGPMDALIGIASAITIAGLVSSRTVTVTQ
jgi:flagellar basal body-associated protein FliL